MRHALLITVSLVLFSCDSDSKRNDDDDDNQGSEVVSKLERPNALARPPSRGVPDELRPPR